MTALTLNLPFTSQPEMAGTAPLLASQASLDPHILVMLSACSFIGKQLSKNQCVHVFFPAKSHREYAKPWRDVQK